MYRLFASTAVGLFVAIAVNVLVPQPVAAVSCGQNRSHNAVFGHRQSGDQLLYMDHPKLNYKLLRVVTYDVKYRSPPTPHYVITYVEALDQFTNHSGGCALLEKGGVGYDFVKLHLKSQRNNGLDFVVRVYGVRHW
ncbi:probable salivary secreted peptide [Cimex lectularius]|uniref:Salivary secreted peptide n=1 Tax=Cimex lectularius TaxID=79782 RepID=A0A8I6TKA4_CIMLE|nr:probable salivary secreted peptide [Cimex lectularius]XP_024083127.1 probable salivary secreted peptide [Cimex lectularius]